MVSFSYLSKWQHLSVIANDISTDLQGKSLAKLLFKMKKVLSKYSNYFAQDSRRKTRIILAYRIPQVSQNSAGKPKRSAVFTDLVCSLF